MQQSVTISFGVLKERGGKKGLSALSEIQSLFAEDKGWKNEAEMLKDMADFRRERLGQ